MQIDVPQTLTSDDIFWEGLLEQVGETYRKDTTTARFALGRLHWWPAAAALTSQTGQPWSKPVGDRDYLLVRLSCTLYPPTERRTRYQSFRLLVDLHPNAGRQPVTAFTLYPQRITAPRQGKFSVKLTPQLKFVDAIDAKLGETGVEIPYPYALPVVEAFGAGQSRVEWRFTHQSDHPLMGDLTTFLVTEAAPESSGVWLTVMAQATLENRFGPIVLGRSDLPPQKIERAIR